MKTATSAYPQLLYIATATILLLSCGQGSTTKASTTDTTKATPTVYEKAQPTGIVQDTLVCRSEQAHSYALYLPPNYDVDKPSPCIVFFDAHARGALPLRMYKDIAEKYGFILVGSNVSKNGMATDALNNTINILWNDVHKRFNIDTNRTYTSGFSGGSKVASLAAIVHGGVAGVIGCAGGFPNLGLGFRHDFAYFGLAGDYDFNLPEMAQLDAYLAQSKYPHQLLTWPGTHSWAPATEFKTAVQWMIANSMKRHLLPKNDSLIADLKSDFDNRIATATAKKDWMTVSLFLNGVTNILDGLADVTAYKKQLANLANSSSYKEATIQVQKILQQEQAQQQELSAVFGGRDEQWWQTKITALNQQASHAKTVQEANSTKRVLAYLGFVGYMNVSRAISMGDLEHAGSYLKVFKTVDPKNPDCSYFAASLNMKKDDAKAAMAALQEAATLGYSDIDQLMSEPTFTALHNDATFQQVLESIRNNHSGKILH